MSELNSESMRKGDGSKFMTPNPVSQKSKNTPLISKVSEISSQNKNPPYFHERNSKN